MNELIERHTDTKQLNDLVQVLLRLALTDIKKAGITAVVYETYRSQARQNYLYCMGRSVNECVSAGIDKTFAMKYCNSQKNECTWTLNSEHSMHKAIDLVPKINGKLTWSFTAPEQISIVNVMTSYGFECGTNWKQNRDSCHYQVKGDYNHVFSSKYTTIYITKVIQKALNKKVNTNLIVDGIWGNKTTIAVDKFCKSKGYKTAQGQLNAVALEALLK